MDRYYVQVCTYNINNLELQRLIIKRALSYSVYDLMIASGLKKDDGLIQLEYLKDEIKNRNYW